MSFLSALRRKPDEDMYEDYEDDTYVDDHYTYEEEPSQQTWAPQGVQPIRSGADMQIVLVTPKEYKEASKVADLLRDMKFVVLNLANTDHTVARRLLDFISGVIYTENGHIMKVATGVYVCGPLLRGPDGRPRRERFRLLLISFDSKKQMREKFHAPAFFYVYGCARGGSPYSKMSSRPSGSRTVTLPRPSFTSPRSANWLSIRVTTSREEPM